MTACPACAAPLAPGQRYCLGCGARLPGAPRCRALRNAERVQPSRRAAARRTRTRPPRPRTAAALVLTMLGTGTLLGSVAVGAPEPSPATVVALAPAAAPTATAAPDPTPQPAPAIDSGPDSGALPDDTAPAPRVPPTRPDSGVAGGGVAEAAAPAAAPAATPDPSATPGPTPTPVATEPPVKHAVLVVLTGQDVEAFAPGSPATYLSHDLAAQGTLLERYDATTTGSLANALSLLAGLTPTPETQADCAATGGVCKVEDGTSSLPSELDDAARSWKAYVDGQATNCDPQANALYSPARNPFVSLALSDCATADVPLAALEGDFSDTDLAPTLAYLVPDRCHDGHDEAACTDPGGSTGLTRADAWLAQWIPKITASKAFADGGLLVVLFDGGGLPAAAQPPAVGALVVSQFTKAGAVTTKRYDHRSLARTLAAIFGVTPPGEAAGRNVAELGRDVLRRSPNVPKSDTNR